MDTNTAFFAYGLYVGDDGQEAERIDEMLLTVTDRCPDVRSAVGGSCLGETVFLVAYSKEVESGGHRGAADISPERRAGWDVQLAHAVQVLGYSDLDGLQAPGWLCFTEVS